MDYLHIREDPVRAVLPKLLRDKTTGRNIVWGTDSYRHLNDACQANAEITVDALLKLDALVYAKDGTLGGKLDEVFG